MLLHKLTFSIFQVLRGNGNSNDNIFNLAISCKMTYFVAIEAFCRGKIGFLSQGQCNCGLILDREMYFSWMLPSLGIRYATRHKLSFYPKIFSFCYGQLSLADLIGLFDKNPS